MAKPIFEGSGVAVVTPFTDNGIDFKKLEELVDFQIKKGTDAIIICGSTGEASTMPDNEHIEAIRCAVSATNHRVPVIAGTGSNDTNHGIHLTKEAMKAGADAALIVTPYYNKCTNTGLVRHYKALASSVDMPIILYNVPSRTNVNIGLSTLEALADTSNIVAIKECNFSEVPEKLSYLGDRFTFYSGEDGLAVPMVSLGAKGVISVVANIMPTYMSEMIHSYLDGDVNKAKDMQLDIIPLVKALFCEVNPIPVKEAMNILGMGVGSPRLPLCELSDSNHKLVKEVLSSYDFGFIKEYFG